MKIMIFLSVFFGKAKMWMTLKIRCACIYQSVTRLSCSFCLMSLGFLLFYLGKCRTNHMIKIQVIKVFIKEASVLWNECGF